MFDIAQGRPLGQPGLKKEVRRRGARPRQCGVHCPACAECSPAVPGSSRCSAADATVIPHPPPHLRLLLCCRRSPPGCGTWIGWTSGSCRWTEPTTTARVRACTMPAAAAAAAVAGAAAAAVAVAPRCIQRGTSGGARWPSNSHRGPPGAPNCAFEKSSNLTPPYVPQTRRQARARA